MTTDLIIIGCGPGGYQAAAYAARNGLKVVIFDGRHAGGTCLNAGCIPTKSLLFDAARHTPLDEAMARKTAIVEQLRQGIEQLMSLPGITFVHAHARFTGPHSVEADGQLYEAPHIIIATGSVAKLPPIPDINRPEVMTSTELLNIPTLPRKLAIIGAGVIGMEFACIFHNMGSEVEVYEFQKECLPTIDKDIAKRLRKQMEKEGVKFHMGTSVASVASLEADAVLVATGRKANVEGLQLETAGIAPSANGIETDDNMQTKVSGVYAIGDVNGRSMLAHAAEFQGFRAVNHILGRKDSIRFNIMPAAVFTTPEVAGVGLSDAACKEQGVPVKVRKGLFRANGKAMTMNATEGLLKLVIAEADDRILGCHVMGPHAADIVQEVAVLMNMNATATRLRDIIHIHPTLGEILHEAVME